MHDTPQDSPPKRPLARRVCLWIGLVLTTASLAVFVLGLLGLVPKLWGFLGFIFMLISPSLIVAGLRTDRDDRAPPGSPGSMMGRGASGGFGL